MYSSNNYGMDESNGVAFDKEFDKDIDLLLDQLSDDDEFCSGCNKAIQIDLNDVYLATGIVLYEQEPIEDVDILLDEAIDFCLLEDKKSMDALKDIYVTIGL